MTLLDVNIKEVLERQIVLKEWEECIGTYERIEINEVDVTVILSIDGQRLILTFSNDGVEADVVKTLISCKAGTKIVLLKTDEASRPLLVRTIGVPSAVIENLGSQIL